MSDSAMEHRLPRPRPLPIAEAFHLRLCLICGASLRPLASAPCPVCQHAQHFCDRHLGLALLRWRVETGALTDWPDTGVLHHLRMTSKLHAESPRLRCYGGDGGE